MKRISLIPVLFTIILISAGFTSGGGYKLSKEMEQKIFPVIVEQMERLHGEGVYVTPQHCRITETADAENYTVVCVEIRPFSDLYPVVSRDSAVLHVTPSGVGVHRYKVLEDYQEG